MKIGIIGCGRISQVYLETSQRFAGAEIEKIADIIPEIAQTRAQEFGITAVSVDELLADAEIEAVLNLTVPAVHAEVGMAILEAGKHLFSEKPIATDLESSKKLIERGETLGLQVCCAPDTVLGASIQSARHLIDSGTIGKPLSGTATMAARGPERFHANPGFFYQKGAGPLFDMGPYYLTSLITLLGPIKSVFGSTTKGFEERICGNEAIRGKRIPVEVPTHYAGTLEFISGPVITLTVSFDVHAHKHSPIEIYGAEGSLVIPDPNYFKGEIELYTATSEKWKTAPQSHSQNADYGRIVGVLDMVEAIEQKRQPRCSGEIAHHVLEVMLAFETSSDEGKRIAIASRPDRPDMLPCDHRFEEKVAVSK